MWGRRGRVTRRKQFGTRGVNNRKRRFWVVSCRKKSSCGEAVGRGTVAVGDGGGAATSRHRPFVNALRCHLPMASPQGGFQAEIGRKSPSPMPRLRSSIQRHEPRHRSEEHTSELQSLMRISYAV